MTRNPRHPPLYKLFEWSRFRVWFRLLYRMEIRNAERIPTDGAVILVANHESLLDPWVLGLATPRPIRYIAKAELFGHPLLARVMRAFGTVPIARGTGDRDAVGEAAQLLREGEVIGIFPQGTCLPHRRRPWLRGAARLALTTGTTIVPVCMVGTERALRPAKIRLGLPKIRVLVCEPIPVAEAKPTVAAARELTARIEQVVETARAPYGPPAHAWYPEPTTG